MPSSTTETAFLRKSQEHELPWLNGPLDPFIGRSVANSTPNQRSNYDGRATALLFPCNIVGISEGMFFRALCRNLYRPAA
jgi:hypothetical protein